MQAVEKVLACIFLLSIKHTHTISPDYFCVLFYPLHITEQRIHRLYKSGMQAGCYLVHFM